SLPLPAKGSARVTSTKCTTRVPTLLGPVGAGAAKACFAATAAGTTGPKTATPSPDSGTTCGLSALLSARVSVPVKVPTAPGVNTTLTVQAIPAPPLVPQSFV